jgi:hypothetical protein
MLNPDFRDMLSAFSAENVEYLIVGAYALAAHGVPRATGDLDFWIRPTRGNADRVLRALRAFGAPLELSHNDLQTPEMVFQIGIQPSRIDILTSIDGVEFNEAWARRTTTTIDGIDVHLLGVDDLLANKRATARPQDLADVAALEAEFTRRSRS